MVGPFTLRTSARQLLSALTAKPQTKKLEIQSLSQTASYTWRVDFLSAPYELLVQRFRKFESTFRSKEFLHRRLRPAREARGWISEGLTQADSVSSNNVNSQNICIVVFIFAKYSIVVNICI